MRSSRWERNTRPPRRRTRSANSCGEPVVRPAQAVRGEDEEALRLGAGDEEHAVPGPPVAVLEEVVMVGGVLGEQQHAGAGRPGRRDDLVDACRGCHARRRSEREGWPGIPGRDRADRAFASRAQGEHRLVHGFELVGLELRQRIGMGRTAEQAGRDGALSRQRTAEVVRMAAFDRDTDPRFYVRRCPLAFSRASTLSKPRSSTGSTGLSEWNRRPRRRTLEARWSSSP